MNAKIEKYVEIKFDDWREASRVSSLIYRLFQQSEDRTCTNILSKIHDRFSCHGGGTISLELYLAEWLCSYLARRRKGLLVDLRNKIREALTTA